MGQNDVLLACLEAETSPAGVDVRAAEGLEPLRDDDPVRIARKDMVWKYN